MDTEKLKIELAAHVNRIMEFYKRKDQLEFNKLNIEQELNRLNKQILEERMIIETLQVVDQTNGFSNTEQFAAQRQNVVNLPAHTTLETVQSHLNLQNVGKLSDLGKQEK